MIFTRLVPAARPIGRAPFEAGSPATAPGRLAQPIYCQLWPDTKPPIGPTRPFCPRWRILAGHQRSALSNTAHC
jgi:hypothetical protein